MEFSDVVIREVSTTKISCTVCRRKVPVEESNYHAYGMTCAACGSALAQRRLPIIVTASRAAYYTEKELAEAFRLPYERIELFVETGILKERLIAVESGEQPRLRLFLLKDNKGFLPPHKVLKFGGWQREADCEEGYLFPSGKDNDYPSTYLASYGVSDFIDLCNCI